MNDFAEYPVPFRILGMGHYLPSRVVSNRELEERMGLRRGWIEKKTGVVERRWVEPGETASDMAANAAAEALREAGIGIEDVSLILNASGTFQRVIPDSAALFQRKLGSRATGIPCMSVHTTCLSFLTAIEVASALLARQSYRNILVLTAEIASYGLDFTSPESASLFGDAAVAAVFSRPRADETGQVHAYRMETYGEGADLTTINLGTERYPYAPGSDPSHALFSMDGKKIYRFAQKRSKGFFDRMFTDFASELENIDLVIPHQSTMLGIMSLKRMGFDMNRVVIILPDYGNCVAASIPLTLYHAIRSGRLHRGDRFLMLGTGAGLSLAAALLTY